MKSSALLTYYRIVSFLLVPVAGIFGFITLIMLGAALSNPGALLPVFTMGATVIYVITSYLFLRRGILQQQPCRPGLRDWIKVNGWVAMFVAISSLIQTVAISVSPDLRQQVTDMASEMMQGKAGSEDLNVAAVMKNAIVISIVFSTLLLSHVILTFRYLREYSGRFEAGA